MYKHEWNIKYLVTIYNYKVLSDYSSFADKIP